MKVSKNGKLYWRDFGDPSQDHYGVFSLLYRVWRMYGLTNSYGHTVWLAAQVALGQFTPPVLECISPTRIEDLQHVERSVTRQVRGETSLSVKPVYFVRYSNERIPFYAYWVTRHISTSVLLVFGVRLIESLFLGSRQVYRFSKSDPAFYYNVEDKVYRPQAKPRYKFRKLSTVVNKVYGWSLIGLHQDQIFLVTSRKDAMTLRTGGMASLWIDGEGLWRVFLKYASYIESRCREVVIVMDNDDAGKKAASSIHSERPNWRVKYMPLGKDPSGFICETLGNYRALRQVLGATDMLRLHNTDKFTG